MYEGQELVQSWERKWPDIGFLDMEPSSWRLGELKREVPQAGGSGDGYVLITWPYRIQQWQERSISFRPRAPASRLTLVDMAQNLQNNFLKRSRLIAMKSLFQTSVNIITVTLHERHGVSNSWQLGGLFNSLFTLTTMGYQSSSLLDHYEENTPVTGGFPHKGAIIVQKRNI